jgi:hypothetical protein
VLDLPNEASSQEPGELLTNHLALLFVEATEALLHQLSIDLNVESVLSDLMGDVGHVRGLPHEDINIVTQEIYEGRFHVWGHAGAHTNSFL